MCCLGTFDRPHENTIYDLKEQLLSEGKAYVYSFHIVFLGRMFYY